MKTNKTSKIVMLLCICFTLIVILKAIYIESIFYLIMLWNLFLVLILYIISNYMRKINNRFILSFLCCSWLFFLINIVPMNVDLMRYYRVTDFDLLIDLNFLIIEILVLLFSFNDVFILSKQYYKSSF